MYLYHFIFMLYMRVAIDCEILKNRETGVENYLINLINHISNSVNLTLIYSQNIHYSFSNKINALTFERPRSALFKFIFSLLRPISHTTDIFHLPIPTAPFWKKPKGSKLVITVHDITPLKFPHFHNIRREIYYKYILKHILSQADIIISVSKSTKKDIVKYFPILESRIKVIYSAAIIEYTKAELPVRYNIHDEYLLYVGTVEPRKNLARLIEAYNLLRPKEKLVIVGCSGWGKKDLYKNKNENIIFTGYVPRADLNKFYSNAKIFIYPSLYEGFGIPILEAMKCRVPVITSNTSSMPEVAGDAAILVNPYSVEEIKDAMARLLKYGNLRKRLIKKGLRQAAKFSWEKTANETIKVYKELYESNPSR